MPPSLARVTSFVTQRRSAFAAFSLYWFDWIGPDRVIQLISVFLFIGLFIYLEIVRWWIVVSPPSYETILLLLIIISFEFIKQLLRCDIARYSGYS